MILELYRQYRKFIYVVRREMEICFIDACPIDNRLYRQQLEKKQSTEWKDHFQLVQCIAIIATGCPKVLRVPIAHLRSP